MTKKPQDPLESKAYQEMLNEVETIVRDVSGSQIDLDQMVGKVERGYHLIQAMQDRLAQTKSRIEELSSKFDPEERAASTTKATEPS